MPALASASRLGLVLVLLASMQSYGLVVTAFVLNRDAVAERYCVNRDRPEMHCDGKCVLKHHLEAQSETERQTALLGVALSATMWLAPVRRLAEPVARPQPAFARPRGTRAPRGAPGEVFRPPQEA